jgi:hypothetical protein
MTIKPVAYINVEERKLEWAEPMTWNTPTIAKMDKIPLYLHPVKELTDDEIADLIKATNDETGFGHIRIFDFVKVFLKVLRKAQEK